MPLYIRQKTKSLLVTFSNYVKLLKWFIADSLWRFKWLTLGILLTGFFGISSQVAAIGQVIYYAKVLQKGKSIEILDWNFNARESIAFLVIVAITVMLWLSVSAFLIYWSRAWIVKMGVKYDAFCSKRILSLFSSTFFDKKSIDVKDDITKDIMLRAAATDSRFCNRIVRICCGGIIAFGTCLAALVPLFYLNPFCTSFILVLLLLSLLCLYKVNVAGAKHSLGLERYAKEARKEKADIIKQLSNVPDFNFFLYISKLYNSGAIKKDLHSYRGRLLAVEYSTLINNFLLAVGIPVILLYMGIYAIRNKGGWEELAIYLLALRYFLVNLRQTGRTVTSINRFYPQLRRYYLMINSFLGKKVEDKQPEVYKIICKSNVINGALPSIDLQKCDRIGVITADPLNRYTLPNFVHSFFPSDPPLVKTILSSAWFSSSNWGYIPTSLRHCLGLSPDINVSDIEYHFKQIGLWDKVAKPFDEFSLDKKLSQKQWENYPSDIKYALKLIAGLKSDKKWIYLHSSGLELLSHKASQYFLKKFNDRILIIVFDNNFSVSNNFPIQKFAIIDNMELIGIVSDEWIKNNNQLLRNILDRSSTKKLTEDVFDEDSLMDDMDFD